MLIRIKRSVQESTKVAFIYFHLHKSLFSSVLTEFHICKTRMQLKCVCGMWDVGRTVIFCTVLDFDTDDLCHSAVLLHNKLV